MTDPNVKAKIITTLEDRGPLVVGSIAWAIKQTSHVTEGAIAELVDEGFVERHEDGHRYKLADGYTPPNGDAA
ncbi:hypothetical protein NLU14_08710 [Marinobacter sp. 71-i]|uniref:MarR family transcriptional regulator n=1 Tax=Marinobacter iranensis TaxID=2962607 RepID=A0ABT5YB73_9GAMM|nr:hypothetical protein [Marinobacter iranensis]MDF0750310.1 hypothetical protein [Marinobacter iranensis]